MNANELATLLFHYWNKTKGVEIPPSLLNDCSDKLRELQAENETLIAKLKTWKQATAEQMAEDAEFYNKRHRIHQRKIKALKTDFSGYITNNSALQNEIEALKEEVKKYEKYIAIGVLEELK